MIITTLIKTITIISKELVVYAVYDMVLQHFTVENFLFLNNTAVTMLIANCIVHSFFHLLLKTLTFLIDMKFDISKTYWNIEEKNFNKKFNKCRYNFATHEKHSFNNPVSFFMMLWIDDLSYSLSLYLDKIVCNLYFIIRSMLESNYSFAYSQLITDLMLSFLILFDLTISPVNYYLLSFVLQLTIENFLNTK